MAWKKSMFRGTGQFSAQHMYEKPESQTDAADSSTHLGPRICPRVFWQAFKDLKDNTTNQK